VQLYVSVDANLKKVNQIKSIYVPFTNAATAQMDVQDVDAPLTQTYIFIH
jgi:hypothetical protein